MDSLQVEIPTIKTTEYFVDTPNTDLRYLAIAKSEKQFQLERYIQVFEENNGFLSNLSILDLLFMEGPNALNYLEQQEIKF